MPTPGGDIELYMNKDRIEITTDKGQGTLRITSSRTPRVDKEASVKKTGPETYEIQLEEYTKYNISY